ncbi:hypothetical protein H0H87_007399 [Tephrocybe sp. NHM501043]|nr:hypothetical protein H0H87_007399 [Tephrocybe sp. NHM501043]
MEAKVTTAKTISNGTLGLRFMQNALRAKQLKEVEAERAPVKDDAEWEVDRKVRDAWGPSSSSNSQTIAYETSYLPFLFSPEASNSSSETGIQKPKGRRVFNKHGVEETEQEPEPTPAPTPDEQKRSKVHPRPKSISGGPGGLFGFPNQQPSKPKNAKTAKQSIYDNTGVGEDLRNASKEKPSIPTPPAKPTFLKPSGVDEPQTAKPSRAASAGSDIIQGARSKKLKRERSGTDGVDGGDEDAKPKKKKKKQPSTT